MTKIEKSSKKPNLHKGHRARLKETYRKSSIDIFQPHVILELLLFFGIPYKDTNEIAHELINKFGSFSGVLNADIQALKSVKNMTDNAALLIHLVSDIAKLSPDAQNPNKCFDSERKIEDFLIHKFKNIHEEKTLLLLLDSTNKLVNHHFLSKGNSAAVGVEISKIVKLANNSDAPKIIIAHNHPKYDFVSSNDIITTKKTAYHLKSVGIELVESFIVTDEKVLGVFRYTNELSDTLKEYKELT